MTAAKKRYVVWTKIDRGAAATPRFFAGNSTWYPLTKKEAEESAYAEAYKTYNCEVEVRDHATGKTVCKVK